MVKGWNLVASKQFWFHTLGHQSMNDVFQFSPLKLIIRNILRSIISWRYWTQKSAKPFSPLALGQCWTQIHYFFFKDTKHPSLKQKTPPETKGTSQPIWLRPALGKIHPNVEDLHSTGSFFCLFTTYQVQTAAARWYPLPTTSFRPLSLPVPPAPVEGSAPSPGQHHPCEAASPFSNPTAELCSPRQLGTNHIIPIRLKSTDILWSCSNTVGGFKQAAQKLAARVGWRGAVYHSLLCCW